MIPVNQTALHDPDNGIIGNCTSACIASMLHIPIEQVPNFGESSLVRMNEWLRPYGLCYLVLDFPEGFKFSDYGIAGLCHELIGETDRTSGFSDKAIHVVVAEDGKILHDPHPSKSGLLNVKHYGLYIALNPWSHTQDKQEAESALTVWEGQYADKCAEFEDLLYTIKAARSILYDVDSAPALRILEEAIAKYE